MQSEEFDKMAKEAADHHYPSYDEGAWTKMETLLDKHLPQKKDNRKRAIFFLILFLLLGGSATFLLINRSQQSKQPLSKEQSLLKDNNSNNKSDNSDIKKSEQKLPNLIPPDKVSANVNKKELLPSGLSVKSNPVSTQIQPFSVLNNKRSQPDKYFSNKGNDQIIARNKSNVITNKPDVKSNTLIDVTPFPDPKNEINNKSVQPNNTFEKNAEIQDQGQPGPGIELKKDNTQKEDSIVFASKSNKNKKAPQKKNNAFFVYISTAPDVNAAGNDKTGKLKLTTGVGLGYTLHEKFTLRTGFYTSRKIYSASPGEYHPPALFWTYYPNLENVDADCKVYEIPVLLSYNFTKSSKQSWLVSAGLSSYLMKRETYNYTYKDPTGQYRSTSRTIYDQNKHFFSVLTLSAGYQRNISKTFFIAAEPYLKIPLTGLGYGKVKLNSAGVSFSLGFKPFGTNNRTKKIVSAANH